MLAGVTYQPSDAFQQVCVPHPSHAQPRGSSWRNRFAANPVSCGLRHLTSVGKSPPLRLIFSRSREKAGSYCKIIEHCIPDMLKQRTSIKAGYVGWAYRRFRPLAKTCLSALDAVAMGAPTEGRNTVASAKTRCAL